MSVQLKCPRCSKKLRVEEGVTQLRCPQCNTVLNLGGSTNTGKRAQDRDKNDNTMAFKIMGGVAVLVICIFIISQVSDDKPAPEPKKTSKAPQYGSGFSLEGGPVSMDEVSSKVPQQLARSLMLGMAQDDPDAIEPLMLWDELFTALAKENNWDQERRYESVDDEGKRKMRDAYLLALMDPDYVQIIQERLLSELEDEIDMPFTDAGVDWCNVRYIIRDKYEDPMLEFIIKAKLLAGRTPAEDGLDPTAWRIYAIKHQQHKMIKGKPKKRGKQDFGSKLGKNPKKKRTRRTGPKGPPQADPKVVVWLKGTSASMQSKINGLIKTTLDDTNPRAGNQARSDLIDAGKAAIPGILTSLSVMNHADDDAQIMDGWMLVQVLREMTSQHFGYGPQNTSGARGGLTQATPADRLKAVRCWFGWWETKGAAFTLDAKKKSIEDEWGTFELEKDKKKKKKKLP